MANLPRGFKEINVANFASQKKSDRFPNFEEEAFEPADWDSNDEDDDFVEDESDDSESENVPPQTAQWRLNLVALAQNHNVSEGVRKKDRVKRHINSVDLYFTACQEKLHVTVPRGLKQRIPGDPDLILKLPRSAKGRRVGGHIDPSKPHSVNNMIVGNLGHLEVLLIACDDGDVLAYYTHVLDHAVQTWIRTGAGVPSIKPFFHENVGNTVWGLALHEKSRLIAASSNLKEVTVFVPACTSESHQYLPLETLPKEAYTDTSKPVDAEERIATLISKHHSEAQKRAFLFMYRKQWQLDNPSDDNFETRNYSYRKVLKLGVGGKNIPSITFVEDENGEAKSILAIDIGGSLWTLGIWDKDDDHRIPSMHWVNPDRPVHPGKFGWGVIIMPPSFFKRCSNPQEALGTLDVKKTCAAGTLGDKVETFLDISSTVRSVADSSVDHHSITVSDPLPIIPELLSGLVVDDDESIHAFPETFTEPDGEYSSEVDSSKQGEIARVVTQPATKSTSVRSSTGYRHIHNNAGSESSVKYVENALKEAQRLRNTEMSDYLSCMLDMSASPAVRGKSAKEMIAILNSHVSEYFQGSYVKHQSTEEPKYVLSNRCAILRLYQWEAELIPPTSLRPRTICKEILKQRYGPLATQPFDILNIVQFDRLSVNITIPELSLVILGSQSGRVALVTMTCLEDNRYLNGEPVFTMRVDRILPTKTQEDQGFRPIAQLLGLAASPLQERNRQTFVRGKAGPRRWRIILHYCDHTILSYEISRNDADELLVL